MILPIHLFTLLAIATQLNTMALELYHCEFLVRLGLVVNRNGFYKVTPLGLTTVEKCTGVMNVCSSQSPVPTGDGV